jgi:F-type H+-transporting ATPase subunit a
MSSLHISISAETIFHLGPFPITNSILTSWVVTAILVTLAIWAKNNIKKTKRPTGLQNFLEMLVEGLHNIAAGITESTARTKVIFPFFFSFFLFILLNNWLGLFPGVGSIGIKEEITSGTEHAYASPANPFITSVNASEPTEANHQDTQAPAYKFVPIFRAGTADLNTTLALALISVASTQVIGIKFLGLSYFKKFINFKGPIDFFVGILETVSEISKIISFAFRLFGNVFAGEVLMAVIAFLIPILIPMPFIGLEIFVGAVQAFVFAVLTLVFMNMATHSHESEEHA